MPTKPVYIYISYVANQDANTRKLLRSNLIPHMSQTKMPTLGNYCAPTSYLICRKPRCQHSETTALPPHTSYVANQDANTRKLLRSHLIPHMSQTKMPTLGNYCAPTSYLICRKPRCQHSETTALPPHTSYVANQDANTRKLLRSPPHTSYVANQDANTRKLLRSNLIPHMSQTKMPTLGNYCAPTSYLICRKPRCQHSETTALPPHTSYVANQDANTRKLLRSHLIPHMSQTKMPTLGNYCAPTSYLICRKPRCQHSETTALHLIPHMRQTKHLLAFVISIQLFKLVIYVIIIYKNNSLQGRIWFVGV